MSTSANVQTLPQSVEMLVNSGIALATDGQQQNNREMLLSAVRQLEEALASVPGIYLALVHLGNAYLALNEPKKAKDIFAGILGVKPQCTTSLCSMGTISGMERHYEKALDYFNRALETDPNHVQSLSQKSRLLLFMHKREEARETMDKALLLTPNNAQLLSAYGTLERQEGNPDKAMQYLDTALLCPMAPQTRFMVLSELGTIADKRQQWDQAMDYITKAKEALFATTAIQQVEPEHFPHIIAENERFFTPERVAAWHPYTPQDNIPSPTFLVGFPRSGTTLMEQILSSHPDIIATEETMALDCVAMQMEKAAGRSGLTYPDSLSDLTQEDITRLRKVYWNTSQSMLRRVLTPGAHVIDKMPINIVHLGLIHRIFPEAKIIVALRDPRDVVLSSFFQPFELNNLTVHLNTLENAARFYAQVMELYLHYKATLPHTIVELRYEDLVADLQGEAGALLDYMGFPWHDDVLNYYSEDRNRYVTTPSYEGVMKPIYTTSQGKWRNYASCFEPLHAILQPYVRAFGYG